MQIQSMGTSGSRGQINTELGVFKGRKRKERAHCQIQELEPVLGRAARCQKASVAPAAGPWVGGWRARRST